MHIRPDSVRILLAHTISAAWVIAGGSRAARHSDGEATWPLGHDWYSHTIAHMHREETATYDAYVHTLPYGVRPPPDNRKLIEEATTWAKELLNHADLGAVLNGADSLRIRLRTMQTFSATHVHGTYRGLPVLYPFSGFDVLSAFAFFPNAPRFVMLAGLSHGDPICFLIAACRTNLANVVTRMLQHWAYRGYAWTETNVMERTLHQFTCCENQTFAGSPPLRPGIIGLLVTSVVLMGHELVELGLQQDGHLRLVTDHTSIDYFSRAIAIDEAVQRAQLEHLRVHTLQGQRVATLMKAAGAGGGYIWLPTRPAFARWVLEISDVVVQDETGLSPAAFGSALVGRQTNTTTDTWHVQTFGNLSQLEVGHYPCLQITPHWRPRQRLSRFAVSINVTHGDIARLGYALDAVYAGAQPQLPFRWGYATGENTCLRNAKADSTHPGGGVLLNAWRAKRSHPHAS